MMSRDNTNGKNQFVMLTIDDLVPQDHLARKIDAALNLELTYPIAETAYSGLGRPSISPVTLIKSVFIQYLFIICSMRQAIKEVNTNVAYRWSLGYSFEEKIPHSSALRENYARRFRETTVFEDVSTYILGQAAKAGPVTEDSLYLDSTHIRANANKRKSTKEMTHDEAKAYQNELENEIDRQRIEARKYPLTLDPEKKVKLKEKKISKADPESGYYVKGEREKQLAHPTHTPCDGNGLVLSTIITPGNAYDSQVVSQFAKQSKKLFPEISCAVADARYKILKFAHLLAHLSLRPCLPYSRPKEKKGLLSKNELLYDEYFDCYICPQNQMLAFSTVIREGYRGYKSNPKECVNCSLLNQCTKSKNHQRIITRHVWGDLTDEVEHLRLADLNKSIYKKRRQVIERVFADAKEKHGTR